MKLTKDQANNIYADFLKEVWGIDEKCFEFIRTLRAMSDKEKESVVKLNRDANVFFYNTTLKMIRSANVGYDIKITLSDRGRN